jgi:hypothetical protein
VDEPLIYILVVGHFALVCVVGWFLFRYRNALTADLDALHMLCGVCVSPVVISWIGFAAGSIFEWPVLCSVVIFSSFVPQIWWNTKRWKRRHWDDWFSVLLGGSRLLLVWYFCFREPNVKIVKSAALGVFLSFYLVAQIAIVLVQNHYGGRFLVPSRFLPRSHAYVRIADSGKQCAICLDDIVSGTEILGTPCGHFFHGECLSEWTARKAICPVCRAELPPFD